MRARARDAAVGLAVRALDRIADLAGIDRGGRLGAAFGRAWARLRGPRTARVRRQLGESFPDLAHDEIEALARQVFEHLGRCLAEAFLLRTRHRSELLGRVCVEGLEHLAAAERLSPSGGVLIVTAHHGNWELAGARMAQLGVPVSVIHRPRGSRALDRALEGLRRAGDGSDAEGDVEEIAMGRAGLPLRRALAAGRKAIVLLDQEAGADESCRVPFFGRPVRVRTGPLRLAQRCRAPLVVAFIERGKGGREHRIRIAPPLGWPEAEAEGAVERRAAEITAAIEDRIRRTPGQWIWTHRRWRTPPAVDAAPGETG